MENILEIKNLSKKYTEFELKNVSLSLPKGKIMGFVGENGAGKTTTIRAILNLIKIDSGEIKIFGSKLENNEKSIKEKIGVLLDDSFLSEYLTPLDLNKIMKNIFKSWNENLYFKYIKELKLPEKKIVKEFSSGMKMKVKIAVALSHNPKLLILDEPTSGLDPIARNEILDIFQDFVQDEENSILVSSHITSDLERVADYISFINDGEIIFTKTKNELLDNFGIAKCTEEEFQKIDKKDYVKFKKNREEYDVLIENKDNFNKKYDIKVIDRANIDDVMYIYIKGEK